MKFLFDKIQLPDDKNYIVKNTSKETISLFLFNLVNTSNQDIIFVTNTLYEANKVYQSLLNYTNNVFLFPMDEFLTSEAIAISPELKTTRIETINNIVQVKDKKIIITHLMGLLRYLPSKEIWQNSIIEIKRNVEIKKELLVNHLFNIGYINETLVTKTGEMSNRGYILDVFPINENNPIRIEFFGDNVESIRYFDIDTQLSTNEIENIKIYPFNEFIVESKDNKSNQKYLPLYTTPFSILNYLNDPILVYKDYTQIKNSYFLLREEIFNYSISKSEKNLNYMHNLEDLSSKNEIYIMGIDSILETKNKKVIDFSSKDAEHYEGNIKKLNEDLNEFLRNNKTVIICLNNNNKIKNIKNYIENKIILTDENKIFENSINIIKKKISDGFIFKDYIVLGESNLYKINEEKSVYKSKYKYGSKIKDLNKLNVGDYVVHNIHGIGIYAGIIAIEKSGIIKDYIQVNYKNNEKLYIPVEKIDLISKYSSNEGISPKINKLGGIEWQKTKIKVKSKLRDIAEKLIKISAEREAKKGYAFKKDTEEQIEFEKEFIYDETKDQLTATEQIKNDMEKLTPMDRLLCGDVGYGKTEVAFRAIFKAVCNGKQVAYLCPTTLLSKQQYNNAIERFKDFPVNIELLNRFVTKNKTKYILDNLKKGKIDILFGTHRILSKDVEFSNIGLLVIDEEQRFGVMHKEKIKEYKANIDVLTLSATPIPRTLQMAMVGLRNLSLIETPPVNRYPVQTYVLEENDYIIKDALYKELSRNGQSFVLYNKIEDIELKVKRIKDLIPEARVAHAHGRMNKTQIEDIMFKFINKDFDILVCTTIIETGIDIPNVNTLIIMDADKFGLGQLYQIRGRVGRTNKIAYAYLMYSKRKVLSDIALKRLNAIKEFTELGSGFSIAVRDLSIRGAGDILGSEQSGFIDTIGIDLYIKMLEDEVKKIKGIEIKEEEEEEPSLINVTTHIDDSYVKKDELKIEIHKKINEIDSYEKLLKIKSELEDRFGKISEDMLIYMYQEWFEKLSKEKGIEQVIQGRNSIEIIFNLDISKNANINEWYEKARNITKNFRFAYNNKKIKVILDSIRLEKHWLYYIIDFVKLL